MAARLRWIQPRDPAKISECNRAGFPVRRSWWRCINATRSSSVGHLVLAHGGNLRLDDLNRQTLMSYAGIGQPRALCIEKRIREFNPNIRLSVISENISESNASRLVGMADLVVDCAPLFEERFLMNHECVRQGKTMVECSIFDSEGHLTIIHPGTTPCLRCLYPETPSYWKRRFPVFGAVASTMGSMAALQAIQIITGVGQPLLGTLLHCDFGSMRFKRLSLRRLPLCSECGHLAQPTATA